MGVIYVVTLIREPENAKKIFQRSCICKRASDEEFLETTSIISCLSLYIETKEAQYLTHIDYNAQCKEQLEQFLSCVGPTSSITRGMVIITSLTNNTLIDTTLEELRSRGIGYGIFVGKWPLNIAIGKGGSMHIIDKDSIRFEAPLEAQNSQFGLEMFSRGYLRCELNNYLRKRPPDK